MTYIRGCLSGIASLFLAGFALMFITAFRDMSQTKAIGLAALAGGVVESIFSPLFWLLATVFFAVFFATGRLTSSVFRVLLFWLPAIGISSLGLGLLGWFAVVILEMRHS